MNRFKFYVFQFNFTKFSLIRFSVICKQCCPKTLVSVHQRGDLNGSVYLFLYSDHQDFQRNNLNCNERSVPWYSYCFPDYENVTKFLQWYQRNRDTIHLLSKRFSTIVEFRSYLEAMRYIPVSFKILCSKVSITKKGNQFWNSITSQFGVTGIPPGEWKLVGMKTIFNKPGFD